MSADAIPSPAVGEQPPPLDEVMLAMDVVDTLRYRERLVIRELDEAGRATDLKQRLKRIYAQQGIDVPDRVIEQAVAALREERFVYKPLKEGLARRLALIYVSRGRWGKWLVAGVVGLLLALVAYYFVLVAPERALPGEVAEAHERLTLVAKGESARERLERLHGRAQAALQDGNTAQARDVLEQLDALHRQLTSEYRVQIVNRPGVPSGVWRVPDVNQAARNHYVVVEAISPGGERLTLPITSEETGRTEEVDTWALRVDEATFEQVKRDKQDDGIIQNDRFGVKDRGYLEPTYNYPTAGGAITRW